MARLRARSLAAIVASLALAGGCAGPASANARPEVVRAGAPPAVPAAVPPPAAAPTVTFAPPPAPAARLWPFKHLFNTDYVDVAAIAERYGLATAWVTSGRTMQLADARGRVRLKFEDRNRDFTLDGVRVFMGDVTVFYKGSLYVSKIDVIKTIAPLLRPGDHANLLPPPPRLIVLDPGHGGNDPGNQNGGLRLDEKAMTLDVAQRLKKLLEARGYRVLLTRTDDRRVELVERDFIAVRAKADLFLSIHFNALPPALAGRVSGSETYALTPQFQASTQPEKEKDMIPALYPGNRQDYANTVLGFQLQRRLLADLGTSDRGYKRARWVVLRFATCPAALIEAAFLSNDTEARRVATPEFRQRIAAAIAGGIDDYAATLAAVHPAATLPTETRSPTASSK
jgi:N-acetylmuramoyl-L-alanine amidase